MKHPASCIILRDIYRVWCWPIEDTGRHFWQYRIRLGKRHYSPYPFPSRAACIADASLRIDRHLLRQRAKWGAA